MEPADKSGSPTVVVHDTGAHAFQPSVSPDGTKLCYTLGPTAGLNSNASILVKPLSPAGSSLVLSSSGNGDYNCTWSPDGTLIAYVRGTFSTGDLVMELADDSSPIRIVLEDTVSRFDGNPDWAPDGRPQCRDVTVQTVRGGSVSVPLRCSDRGPGYERTPVTEGVAVGPSDGSLGAVQQGTPTRVRYTPNSGFTGTETFTFRGTDTAGPGPTAVAAVEVLLPGRCGNFQRGTGAADTLVGTKFGDLLRGLRGADELRGLAGDDCLEGGSGNDDLKGGPGKDLLVGGAGRNQYEGGGGNDTIRARNDRVELVACGPGRDKAVVDSGDVVAGCEAVQRG
jgi:Ca2+-binding RTX toxin-like protein